MTHLLLPGDGRITLTDGIVQACVCNAQYSSAFIRPRASVRCGSDPEVSSLTLRDGRLLRLQRLDARLLLLGGLAIGLFGCSSCQLCTLDKKYEVFCCLQHDRPTCWPAKAASRSPMTTLSSAKGFTTRNTCKVLHATASHIDQGGLLTLVGCSLLSLQLLDALKQCGLLNAGVCLGLKESTCQPSVVLREGPDARGIHDRHIAC